MASTSQRDYFRKHQDALTRAINVAVNEAVLRQPDTSDELAVLVAESLITRHGELHEKEAARHLERTAHESERHAVTAQEMAKWAAAKLEAEGGAFSELARSSGVEASKAVEAAREAKLAARKQMVKVVNMMRVGRRSTTSEAALAGVHAELARTRAALERTRAELEAVKASREAGSAEVKLDRAAAVLQARARGRRARKLAADLATAEAAAADARAVGRVSDAAEAAWAVVEEKLGSAVPSQKAHHGADEKLTTDAKTFVYGGTDEFLKGAISVQLGRSMEEEFRDNEGGAYWHEYVYVCERGAEEDVDADGGPLCHSTAKFRGQISSSGIQIVRDAGHAGFTLQMFAQLPMAVDAGLTVAEVAALRLYSGPAFKPINDALRKRDAAAWRTTISCTMSAVLKLSALAKHAPTAPQHPPAPTTPSPPPPPPPPPHHPRPHRPRITTPPPPPPPTPPLSTRPAPTPPPPTPSQHAPRVPLACTGQHGYTVVCARRTWCSPPPSSTA
jgi:hypothetical protein